MEWKDWLYVCHVWGGQRLHGFNKSLLLFKLISFDKFIKCIQVSFSQHFLTVFVTSLTRFRSRLFIFYFSSIVSRFSSLLQVKLNNSLSRDEWGIGWKSIARNCKTIHIQTHPHITSVMRHNTLNWCHRFVPKRVSVRKRKTRKKERERARERECQNNKRFKSKTKSSICIHKTAAPATTEMWLKYTCLLAIEYRQL